jgi:FdhD protein
METRRDMKPAFLKLPVERIEPGGISQAFDSVAVEEPLEIVVGGRNLAITMRTPGNDAELAAGFLFTEGLLAHPDGIRHINGDGDENRVLIELADGVTIDRQDRRFASTSACGVCGKEAVDTLHVACKPIESGLFEIDREILCALPSLLRHAQDVFERTGGIHAAALFDSNGRLELIREDVGRHNAVDKIIGAMFLQGRLPLYDRVILVSGRASFELVQKAAMAGIPVLAAVGAPSTLAVETGRHFNMTLAGFVKQDRFNIYCGAGRIVSDGQRERVPEHAAHATLK